MTIIRIRIPTRIMAMTNLYPSLAARKRSHKWVVESENCHWRPVLTWLFNKYVNRSCPFAVIGKGASSKANWVITRRQGEHIAIAMELVCTYRHAVSRIGLLCLCPKDIISLVPTVSPPLPRQFEGRRNLIHSSLWSHSTWGAHPSWLWHVGCSNCQRR